MQDFLPGLIREAYVAEGNGAFDRWHRNGVRSIVNGNGLTERLKDSLEISHVIQEVVEDVSHVHDRLPEPRGVARNRDDRTDCLASLSEQDHAGDEDCGTDANRNRVDTGPYKVVAAYCLHPGVTAVIRETGEDLGVLVFTGENLRDARADDVLLQVSVQVRVLIGNPLPCPALTVLDPEQERGQDRHAAHNDERHLHVHDQHEDDNQEQVDHLENDVDQTVRKHIRNGVDIVDNANQNLAVRPVVEVLEGQLLQMREEIFTDIVNDALGYPDHHMRPDGRQNDADDEHGNQHCAEEEEVLLVLVRNGYVECLLRKHRRKQRDAAAERTDQKGDDHAAQVFLNICGSEKEMSYVKRLFQALILFVGIALCHDSTSP